MGASQLLLTAFVVYWLFGQYKNEEESLSKEMHFEFIQAQYQAMDSTLHVMLKPFLSDSLALDDSIRQIDVFGPTNIVDSVEINSIVTTQARTSNKIIQFDIRDSIHHSSGSSAKYEITAFPHKDAVLRGAKLIIKMSEDSLSSDGNAISTLTMDSAVFLDIAASRLKENDHSNFGIVWYEDSLDKIDVNTNGKILFRPGFSHPEIVYEITNYKPFLLRKIVPQILFGLLLLLLTAFAFVFTYRSLMRQMLLNTLRNEFISNVSHELKTPVSTVKVALEALQNYDQKKDRNISEEYLKMASLEMDRLDLLIQKILNQSLLESKQMMITRESQDLIRIINDIIESFRPRLDQKNGKILFNPDVEEARIQLDPLYIQGVLINLLDNALKYGGEQPLITVSYRENHKMVFVDIADNGEGIPKQYQDKIFERFFRIPTNNRHNVKGYGLGLSFAYEVMAQHGGWIKVRNNPDGGSIFTLGFNNNGYD